MKKRFNKPNLTFTLNPKLDFEKITWSPEHFPVLYKEIASAAPDNDPDRILNYFDGTFGRGGHYQILRHFFPNIQAVATDQDLAACEYAKSNYAPDIASKNLQIVHCNFFEFQSLEEFKDHNFDLMLLDLGVSSPQLDTAERGFSFYHDGPLDMRMNQASHLTAEYIVNTYDEEDLNELFKEFGEIYKPYRVTRALVHDRKKQAFTTTRSIASLIERVDGWKIKGQHPATKYFMALRLAVNNELGVLKETIPSLIHRLKPGGRLCVITFHSLEDRIVKNLFKELSPLGGPIHKKIIAPSELECKQNSRSRSAKLRIFERKVQDEPNHSEDDNEDEQEQD